MKAVVTWAFLIVCFQFAARADAAKPRKPAKRKDKLSKISDAPKIPWGVRITAAAENPGKRWQAGAFSPWETRAAGDGTKNTAFAMDV
ncbi:MULTISPECIES: hypothetical protein [unclassified Mesorhizobium]|uniref:hypothetical protein n=1 Tax=unclassified Mesorhizobium TaxID=325217 RepID=UPI000FD44D3C|nr:MULTISPECIES: hypothetical protein [unclassified Mesorhizobium]MCQ8870592.1 hypothetical protein [Mesorhizobium sp. LMG17149]RUU77909.1 hypothetical protein EOC06_21865 [Mesorhizobium sp. M7A.F.Ca.MR.362.00.0.0]RWN91021.1 MAG: hypothetical protein EOS05_24825 [Mesorhizobium sp.]